MQTNTTPWEASTESEASQLSRSLDPTNKNLRITKVQYCIFIKHFGMHVKKMFYGHKVCFSSLSRVHSLSVLGGRTSQAIVDAALNALRSLVKDRLGGKTRGSDYSRQVLKLCMKILLSYCFICLSLIDSVML